MLVPFSTDAPLYHRPWGTIAMISLNVMAFMFGLTLEPEVWERYILQYGWINPGQWLSSNFMHAGPLHLLSNMFGLWGFGLVVEGKIGWQKFIALYLGIGMGECAVEQIIGLFIGHGGSFGASAIVYGLIAVAMIWAPKNNMNCMWICGFGMEPFEVPIQVLAYMYFAFSFLMTIWSNIAMGSVGILAISSEFLHLLGAAVGAAIAVIMLQKKAVDCEHWDLFSVMKGDHLKPKEELEPENKELKMKKMGAEMLQKLRQCLENNQPGAARAQHIEAKQYVQGWKIPEPELCTLIEQLLKATRWNDAIEHIVEYLQLYTEKTAAMRIWLARILLEKQQKPLQTLKVLAKLQGVPLTPAMADQVAKIKAIATPLAEDNPYEVTHDW